MWPWEHLAFGYVLYSLLVRTAWRRTPGGAEAVALALATQLPDLIDKPLSWGLGVFPVGYALGHSLVFAIPVSAVVWLAARRRRRERVGVAFAVGYASHLAGDLLSPFLLTGRVAIERLLWPFVSFPAYEMRRGFADRFALYVGRYLHELAEPSSLPYVLIYLAVFLGVTALWVTDGAPGLRELAAAFRPGA